MNSLNILKNNYIFFTAGFSSALLLTWCFVKLQELTGRKKTDVTLHSINKDHLRILIIGGSNSGKTSTLKYLAGHSTTGTFSNFPHLEYVCNDDVYGWKLFAVKCKNVQASSTKRLDDKRLLCYNLKKILKIMDEFHIVIFCLSLKKITRKDPRDYISIMRHTLESQIIKNHVVLAIIIDEDLEVPQNEDSFNGYKEFLNKLKLSTMKNIVNNFKNRCFFLHTNTRNEEKKREEIMRFLAMCQDIVWDNASLALSKVVGDISKQNQNRNEQGVEQIGDSCTDESITVTRHVIPDYQYVPSWSLRSSPEFQGAFYEPRKHLDIPHGIIWQSRSSPEFRSVNYEPGKDLDITIRNPEKEYRLRPSMQYGTLRSRAYDDKKLEDPSYPVKTKKRDGVINVHDK